MDKQTVYDIHKSLVEHNIITKQRVKECSTIKMRTDELKHNKGHSRRLLRCGYVHLCPICSAIQDKKIIKKVRPLVNLLQRNDGDVHLITFTLRHNRSHTLEELTELLNKSFKEMKNTYTYKKFYGSKDRLFSLRKNEIAWSEESGYHPHCHLQIGTTNQTPLKEIESEFKSKWIQIVTKHSPDRTMIPSEDYCCNLVSNPSIEHSIGKVEILSRGRRTFNQEGLQKIVMDNDSAADETPLVEPNLFKKIVHALKTIYKNCLNRYRYVFQVNKRHRLFIENDIGSPLSSLKKIDPICYNRVNKMREEMTLLSN